MFGGPTSFSNLTIWIYSSWTGMGLGFALAISNCVKRPNLSFTSTILIDRYIGLAKLEFTSKNMKIINLHRALSLFLKLQSSILDCLLNQILETNTIISRMTKLIMILTIFFIFDLFDWRDFMPFKEFSCLSLINMSKFGLLSLCRKHKLWSYGIFSLFIWLVLMKGTYMVA